MSSSTAYLAGIATADITPPVGTPLGGFASRGFHTSTGIYHPLRAVVTSLGDGTTDVLLVGIEWLGCYDDVATRLASRIEAATGVPRDRILLNSSHTHCGPAHCGPSFQVGGEHWLGAVDPADVEPTIDRIVVAAVTAHTHRYEARLHRAVGQCTVAMNRRRPSRQIPGRVERSMQPNPDGAVDHDVPVITVSSAEEGTVRGVLFGYACHPTSRGGLQAGGDYVGYALDAVGDAFPNAQSLFLQGCGGDQKPRPTTPGATTFGQRSLDEVREIGDELGAGVVAAVTGDRVEISGPIGASFATAHLTTEPVTLDIIAEHRDAPERYRREWAEHWQGTLDAGGASHSEVDLDLQVIRFGTDLAIIGMGGEMTVEHSLRLKRDLTDEFGQVMPLGYSNTMVGYVPVARQFDEWGYEVMDANQYAGHSGRYVPETEDIIHSRISELVADAGVTA